MIVAAAGNPQGVIVLRPLTAPCTGSFAPEFQEIAPEALLSAQFERRYGWLSHRSDLLLRLSIALRLLNCRRSAQWIVTGRYGEYFALLQGITRLGKCPHLLLDVEWLSHAKPGLRKVVSRWIRRRIILGATRVQVFCHAEARNYARYFDVDESRFVWIPYCADAPDTSATVRSGDYILTSGFKERDYSTLFAAIANIDIELRAVAPASVFASMKVPDNVKILGLLSRSEYARVLAASRFVVLSLEDGCLRYPGVMTYVAAMRAGKCVVVNDPIGAASYIDDGRTGFLVTPRDPEALRSRIQTLLTHPETVAAVAETARIDAENRFSPECYFRAVRRCLAAGPSL